MNNENRLALARDILSTDWAALSDDVALDEINGRPVTQREKQMAQVISNLYRIIHPHVACPHEDWDTENMKNIKKDCSKCHGNGWYQYDDIHSTICDQCCLHDKGWWKLTEVHGKNAGKMCCKAGCGFINENL